MSTTNDSGEHPGMVSDRVQLIGLEAGQCGQISRVDADGEEVARMKSMGICIGRQVQALRPGDPMIVRVLGTRIGLSARLAEHVWIDNCQHLGSLES